MLGAGLALLGGPAPGASVATSGPELAATATAGAAYTALEPTRLLDTRLAGAALGPRGSTSLAVTGGSVPADATAVAVNVTVTDTTAASYLTVYPAGVAPPMISNLNWSPGQTVANLVIVPVGSGGEVEFYNYAGSTDLVVDLEGYFAPELTGSTVGAYLALTPARIADTRVGSGYPAAGTPLGPGASLAVQVAGVGGVPATGVSAALLNVTVSNPAAAGYLTVFPTGLARPTASNLNWVKGQTLANRVVVPLGSGGQISLYNQSGTTNVVVDVDGYFSSGTVSSNTLSLFSALSPVRVLDTRQTNSPLGAAASVTVQMGGVAGIAASASAVVANVTATDTTADSYLTVYPGGPPPLASDLNWSAGETVPNLTVAGLSASGTLSIYNHAGSVAVVVDVFGYFSPVGSGSTSSTTPTIASANWSGYEVGDGPYTSVAGTFTVPDLAPSGTYSAMAEWVGIDGAANSSLIQAGVGESYDPTTNLVQIQPWWEILPAPETPITSLTVVPGNTVTVAISQSSASTWTIQVTNDSTGQRFATDQSYTGPLSSAEWIVEAPTVSSSGAVAALGAYSPNITFTGLQSVGTSLGTTAVVMEQSGQVVSVPSALTAVGFTVAYGSTTPAAP
ncbi:MAG: hypothetical protein HKL89_01330 [Candidatus Dormibacteraeota bacterium]|nr:hypothetical protein [Candidatus Dormibacteraeota bacterium]